MGLRGHGDGRKRWRAVLALSVAISSLLLPLGSLPARAGTLSGVSVPTMSTTAAGATKVRYVFGFTASSTGALAPSVGTITVAAPVGTTLAPCTHTIHDDTTGQDVFRGCRTVSPDGLSITLGLGVGVNANDHVTVTLDGVTNPGVGIYTLRVSTSSDPTPVASPPYSTTAPQAVSGVSAPTPSTTTKGAVTSWV